MQRSDDRGLVLAARDGSQDARAELARRHWRSAWSRAFAVTGRSAVADDIAQESVVTALAKLDDLAYGSPRGLSVSARRSSVSATGPHWPSRVRASASRWRSTASPMRRRGRG